jgi:hypothetical protein
MTATRSNFGKYKINNEIKGQILFPGRRLSLLVKQTPSTLDLIISSEQMIIHSQI